MIVSLAEGKKIGVGLCNERMDLLTTESKQTIDVGCGAISETNPDDLGRRATQHAESLEILILRHEHKSLGCARAQIASSVAPPSPSDLTCADFG